MKRVDLGMKESELKQVAEILSDLLADSYAVYLKTQNYHWNMQGEGFIGLHLLLQKQYEELAEAVDEIAERIRALGHYADGSFGSFQKRSKIQDPKPKSSLLNMVKTLKEDHHKVAKRFRPMILKCQELNDEMSADLIIERLRSHEKAAWLLAANL